MMNGVRNRKGESMNKDKKCSTSIEHCHGDIDNRDVYREGDDGKEIHIGIVGPSGHNSTTIAQVIAKSLREVNFMK